LSGRASKGLFLYECGGEVRLREWDCVVDVVGAWVALCEAVVWVGLMASGVVEANR